MKFKNGDYVINRNQKRGIISGVDIIIDNIQVYFVKYANKVKSEYETNLTLIPKK